jgi:small-conductance mechanosensitive channel
VLFLSFGESSLDFELRVWVLDAEKRLTVKSELHQEIDRRFREAKIEIAFPQRDLHLRSVAESVILKPPKTTG